jgi:hypothetical protein
MRREAKAGMFVTAMVALGAGVVSHWLTSVQAKAAAERHLMELAHETVPANASQLNIAIHAIHRQLADLNKPPTEYSPEAQNPTAMARREAIRRQYPQFCRFASVKYSEAAITRDQHTITLLATFTSRIGTTTGVRYLIDISGHNCHIDWITPYRRFTGGIGWDTPDPATGSPDSRRVTLTPKPKGQTGSPATWESPPPWTVKNSNLSPP